MQHTHYTSTFSKKQFPIVLICDDIENAANIGGLFRLADAFGVEKLVFCGERSSLGKRFKKSSRSTENVVSHSIEPDIVTVTKDLKDKNYRLIALEHTTLSESILKCNLSQTPLALIVGNEVSGISEKVLKTADAIIHIDMYGNNSSMNVVQAAGIALYEITRQLQE